METVIMAKDHRIQKHELAAILRHFAIEPTDVLLIGSGSTHIAAKLGAFAAAFTLLD
jgi:hypothetical protein